MHLCVEELYNTKAPIIFYFLPVLHFLADNYEEALQRDDVKAIVVTGKHPSLSIKFALK